jgi:archaellin
MKSGSFIILILIFCFAVSVISSSAQPNWGLSPQDYEFSMTITGKITTNGYFSVNENDLVAAFANGECRGITNLKYENFMDEYFVYLMVYSNTPMEEITFKIFDASQNLVVSTNDKIIFTINQIVGSLDVPYIFSSNLLNSEARLLSFTIPDQIGETLIDNNNFYLKGNSNSTLTGIKAEFSTSTGAKVYINGVQQVSSITINDFTDPVQYMVISANMSDTVVYTIQISVSANSPPSAIKLSNTLISESVLLNTVVATFSVEDPDIGDKHVFSLIEGNGFNDSENSMFSINGNELILIKPLNFKDQQMLYFLVRVTDNHGASLDQSFELKVTNDNNPPEFNSTPPKFVLQGEMYIYSILINDDNGEIEISFEGLPSWLTYNPNSRLISGLAGNDDVGDYSFTITASDNLMESVQNVVVSVININDPPEINYYIEDQFFFVDRENEIQLPFGCISDPDVGDSITFELTSDNNSALPHWMNFNSETFILSGKPPKGTDEKLSLKLTATDKGKLKEWIVFRIYVISNPTSVNDLEDNQIFRCYPNPVKDQLQLNIPGGNEEVKVSIVNVEGQILKNMLLNVGGQYIIPFEGASGMYFIHFRQGEYQQIVKIIKH